MKTITTIIAITLLIMSISNALPQPKRNVQITENTVETLIMGLNSDNLGLKSSSAYMIGELQLSEGVIPLLKILHNEENEELRIAAALALYKIGSPVAIFAVKQAIKFDESERVSKLCANFYAEYQKSKLNDEELNKDTVLTASK